MDYEGIIPLHRRIITLAMALFLAASVVGITYSNDSLTPTAQAQDTGWPKPPGEDQPKITKGVWAITAIALGGQQHLVMGVEEGGPGYVDIVGQPCDPT